MSVKVISAFPGCGKTTYYNNWSIYSPCNILKRSHGCGITINNIPLSDKILDSDSSLFSWIYDEFGNKTDIRNPDFPNNYIRHIKEHMETEDVIFVSSHKIVRDALKANNIPFIMIYPDKKLKSEWMRRFKERGNNESFIKFQEEHWDEFIDDIENDDYPQKIKLINDNSNSDFITVSIMNNIMNNNI